MAGFDITEADVGAFLLLFFGCSYRFIVVNKNVVSFFCVLRLLSQPAFACAFLVERVVYRVFSLDLFH